MMGKKKEAGGNRADGKCSLSFVETLTIDLKIKKKGEKGEK